MLSSYFENLLNKQEQIVILITIVMLLVFSITIEGFSSWGNILVILRNASILGIFALGMAVVIICRGIDLSQIAVALVAAGISIKLMELGQNLLIAVSVGFIIAMSMGLLNATIIRYLQVPALFTTLATALLYVGVVREWVLKSMLINVPPEQLTFLALGHSWLNIPLPLIVFLVCALIVHIVLHHTVLGRFFYAYGDNPEAARMIGVPTTLTIFSAYLICSTLAFIGGLLLVASTALVDLKMIQSTYIFDVILVVILGGVSLSGGRGSVVSILVGVLLLSVLFSGMTLLNINYQLQNIIKGFVLLAVIILDARVYAKDEEEIEQGI